MARLPRHHAGDLTAQSPRLALKAWLLLLLASTAPAAASQVELIGTWHVLVHYTDDHSAHPDVMRWEDRIWVFERAGSRLRWTEYPIVIFEDRAGRFEVLGTNRVSRVLHAWQPNPGQVAQIESGLEVNPRGKKSKALRGSDAEGWRSNSRPTRASASVVTYTENWSITGMPTLPVFERVDVLGSTRSAAMDGVTRYTTTEVEAGGAKLRGIFERDGTRRGTFHMTRAGSVSGVKGSGKSEGERVDELDEGRSLEEGRITP
jgi:hypothetical protein